MTVDDETPLKADEIRLDILGDEGAIDPRAVSDGIQHLVGLLEHLLPDQDGKTSWSLSSLRIGSAKVGVRGSAASVAAAEHGLEDLASGAGIPNDWTAEAVNHVIRLGEIAKRRGVSGIRIQAARAVADIDAALLEHARDSLVPWPMSIGSVQGRLYRYNDEDHDAGIVDEVTEQRVKVLVPRKHADQVAQYLRRDVCVWGEIHHKPTGDIDRLAMEGIELLPAPEPHAPISELASILGPDWTGGLDAVEAVRRQRD